MRIGDPIFSNQGEPGVVVSHEKNTQKIKVDTNQAAVQQQFRHGYLKGLDQEARQQLYRILDEVVASQEPQEKVEKLQAKIQEYEASVDPRSLQMLGYLKAELSHIINTYQYQPRFYKVGAYRAP